MSCKHPSQSRVLLYFSRSSFYPANYGHNPSQVKTACQVLRSFYQYLLFHRVCDEYKDQILIARTLCDKAEKELPQTYIAGNFLPGAFNVAASTIFGGMHAGTFVGLSEWTAELSEEERKNMQAVGMRNEIASVTFKTAVAAYGTEEQYDLLTSAGPTLKDIKKLSTESLGLEITSIQPSTKDIQEVYAHQNEVYKHKLYLQTLGKMTCKPWTDTTSIKEFDLPKNNPKYPGGKPPPPDPNRVFEFWVEDDVLEKCFVGMKMDVTVFTLRGGITILDEIKEIFCSFYKWIPNELWVWKKGPKFRYTRKGMEDIDGHGEDEEALDGDGRDGGGAIRGKGQDLEAGEMSDDYEE